jgi:hypothetical protein
MKETLDEVSLLKQKEIKILKKLNKKKTKKLESKLKHVKRQLDDLSKNVWTKGICNYHFSKARQFSFKIDARIWLTNLFLQLKSKKYESHIAYYIKDKETNHKNLFMIYCRNSNVLICDKIEIFGAIINKFNLDKAQIKQLVFELVNKIFNLNIVRDKNENLDYDNIMSIILPSSYVFGQVIKNYPDVSSNNYEFLKNISNNTIDPELFDFNKERLKSILERSKGINTQIKRTSEICNEPVVDIIKELESDKSIVADDNSVNIENLDEYLNKKQQKFTNQDIESKIIDSETLANRSDNKINWDIDIRPSEPNSENLNISEFNIEDIKFD